MSLKYLEQISSSGIAHPYYSIEPVPQPSQDMHIRIISNPPLDGVTHVERGSDQLAFHVLVESEADYGKIEVELWHNVTASRNWKEQRLAPAPDRHIFSASQPSSSSDSPSKYIYRWFFGVIKLDIQRTPASFTIRFRLTGESDWRWVRDQHGANDGLLLYSASSQAADLQFSDVFDGYESTFNVTSLSPETPHTTLWSLKATAAPAQGEKSGYSDLVLGSPVRLVRWFAIVRLWGPWLAPRQGRGSPFAEKDAILYSFMRNDGRHVAALAISGVKDVLSVFRSDHGRLVLNARNDREEEGPVEAVVAVGFEFEKAIKAVINYARKVVMDSNPDIKAWSAIERPQPTDDGVKASWNHNWYDGLTYCTWNGLGQNLTPEKILGAIDSLKQRDVKITNLIIDDNWQSLDNEGQSQFHRGWTDFEANPKAFPQGLKALTSTIRSAFPNIKHIAVWHALLGYWGAMSPNGNIAKTYKMREVVKRDSVVGGRFTVVDAPDVKQMYDDFYSFLMRSGVDSVKADAQFFLDEIDSAPARRELTSTYLSTWMTAQRRHLSGNAISCMSQTPTTIFQCQLPNDSSPLPIRISDDFFPDVDDSHPWHIFCNSHTAILAQYLACLPDHDMFQTSHKWASFHAADRCMSGGPISITDTPGEHDVDLINQMTAKTTRGDTVILRPSVIGRSVEPYVSYEEERLHKVTAYNGDFDTGTSFVAVFNLRNFPITEIVHLSDFLGVSSKKYVLRHHHPDRNAALDGMSIISDESDDKGYKNNVFGIMPRGHSWNIMTATPIWGPYKISDSLPLIELSNLGLLNKMTGAAAILKTKIQIVEPSPSASAQEPSLATAASSLVKKLQITTKLKGLGVFALWISSFKNIDDWSNRILATIQGTPLPLEFARRTGPDESVLELDVQAAWEKLGLEGGESNDLDLEIHIH